MEHVYSNIRRCIAFLNIDRTFDISVQRRGKCLFLSLQMLPCANPPTLINGLMQNLVAILKLDHGMHMLQDI